MASQMTLTGDEVNARPVTRPGEILEAVPGLIVTQHSGEGKANQYFLRGYNLDHGTDMAIWVDDVPVNMRTHAHGQGYADLNWLMPETVNSVEVRKGPYYADEGDFGNDRRQLRLRAFLRHGLDQNGRGDTAVCGRGRRL
jgi:outer membrane receptor for ferrienterochelin and colicin